MTFTTKLLGGAAAVAVFAGAVPAAAQYYSSQYDTNPYVAGTQYGSRYASPYDRNPYARGTQYAYGANTNLAAQQCSAAVLQRLYIRCSIGGILGAVLGANTTGRVLSVTKVAPRNNGMVRVRGLASSGRYAMNGYGPYGMGAYGALGYGYNNAADLSFRCDVAPNGAVYRVDITRRDAAAGVEQEERRVRPALFLWSWGHLRFRGAPE